MCCRYWMEESPELRPFVEAVNRSPLKDKMVSKLARPIKTTGEIRPTDMVPVVAPNAKGEAVVFPMIWGFSNPKAGQPLVNCRVETVATKPTWRESWERHRCIVPASWYYEWEHRTRNDGKKETGDKFLIQPKDTPVVWMGGLYRIEEGLPVFVILTREAAEPIRFIHDRMPLILPEDRIDEWIRPDSPADRLAELARTDMVFERAG